MKKRYTISLMVSTAAVLAACGGGGGDATSNSNPSSPTSKPSFNLTGTVPGTLIEAFCENGSYHAVNSDNNSSSRHPFVLKIPTDLSCRLVMTTNENDPTNKVVTPIRFVSNDGTRSIAFSASDDVDLAHVDLALTRDQMRSDVNQDGVEDQPIEVNLDDVSSEVMDVIENEIDPLDKDDDEIIDMFEDDDDDKIHNHDDDDDDGDGIKDEDDSDHDDDDDRDGVKDDDDVDDDNDGIEDEDDEDEEDNNGDGGGTNPDLVTTPSAGRLLASQCAQCHRTDANPIKGFEDLIGEEIYGDLDEMKRENKRELMHLQANGYSDAQIRLMDDYFNNLSAKKGDE